VVTLGVGWSQHDRFAKIDTDSGGSNPEDVETGDGSSVFSSLELGVVEVSGYDNDSVGDGASKICLGGLDGITSGN
jgi:hypothetical protein